MAPIMDIARRHGLIVIEDAAQAHGAEYHSKRVGGLGDLGCFSFYPAKNLGAYGEGGIVVTNNPEYDRIIRMQRDWGQDRKYHHLLPGYNYRMDALQGAILHIKLRYLDTWTEARRRRGAHYNELLQGFGGQLPTEASSVRHVYHIYAIRTPQRTALQQRLQMHGIETGIHYPIPVHLQPAYAHLGYKEAAFPHSETAAREVLSLPIFPELTPHQLHFVASIVRHEQAILR
jgi:dTDP-4-amino-4,6-dideoxygalactose transaminase